MTARRTTARAVLETRRGYGVDTVFGIPGTHSLEFYRPLRELGPLGMDELVNKRLLYIKDRTAEEG